MQAACRRGTRLVEELAIDAGLLYVAVGGAALRASRAGVRPMGFSDQLVLLAAVHFHYAGLLLPVLAGMARRARQGPATAAAAIGAAVGMPAVALGISFSPLLEVLGTVLLATAGAVVAATELGLATRPATSRAQAALLGSPGSRCSSGWRWPRSSPSPARPAPPGSRCRP